MANYAYYLGPEFEHAGTPVRPAGWYGPSERKLRIPNGGNYDGSAVFACDPAEAVDVTTYDYLGTGDVRTLGLTVLSRSAWQSHFGHRPTVDATTLLDAIREHFTSQPNVLLPTREGQLEIHFPGHSQVWSDRWDLNRASRYRGEVFALWQRNYARNRLAAGDDVADQYLDWLTYRNSGERDYQARKANRALWEQFVPPGQRPGHRGPKQFGTAYEDTFATDPTTSRWKAYNRASPYAENSSGHAWDSSNEEYDNTSSNDVWKVYQTAVANDDHEVWCHRTNTGGNNAGPACRAASASWGQEGYYGFVWGGVLYFRDGDGTERGIASGGSGLQWTDWVKVYPNGSTQKAYSGGASSGAPSWTERVSVTDTEHSGGLYAGIGNWGAVLHSLDSWNVDDLAAGGAGSPIGYYRRHAGV